MKYETLLDGLEISVLKLSEVLQEDKNLRIESEFFAKEYLQIISQVASHGFKPLDEIALKVSDGTHFTPNYKDSGVPFLSALNVKEGYLDLSANYRYISEKEHQELYKRCDPKAGDVLLRKVGVGARHACVIPSDVFEFSIFVSVAQIRCKEGLNPYFLATYINSELGQKQLIRYNKGSSQPDLHLEEIRKLKVPFLADDFQTRIEELVKAAHEKLEQSKALYAEAESLLLDELGLRDFEPSNENVAVKSFKESFAASGRLDAEFYQPKYDQLKASVKANAVSVRRVGEMATFNQRGEQPRYVADGDLKIINSRHILEQHLDYDNFERTTADEWNLLPLARVFRNDILIYTTGANVGRTNVYLSDERALASNHVNILRVENANPIYVAFVLNSLVGRMQTKQIITGSAQAELYSNAIAQFIVPFVAEEIQQEIVDCVEKSFVAKYESKRLLDAAKRGVELAIEQDERAAFDYFGQS